MRVTSSRIAVATVLIKNNQFLSAEEIFKKITLSQNLKCDQASVYRTLTIFEKLKIITSSHFQGEPSRFKLSFFEDQGEKEHSHFFKCDKCQKIEPFSGCFLPEKERELKKLGYSQLSHHLEIRGICPSCS